MKQHYESIIKNVISEQLGLSVDQVRNEQYLAKDLKADSLDAVAILISLEEELGVELTDEDSLKIKTVQDAIDIFSKLKTHTPVIQL